MAEGILQSLVGQERAVRALHPLRDHHGAVAALLDERIDLCDEALLVECDLGKQDHDGDLGLRVRREAPGRRDPAGVTAHDLEHEHLRGRLCHGADVEACLTSGDGDVLGHRPESRAVVGHRQVVVDGLGDVDGLDGRPDALRELRDFEAGVGGVATAVVEEVADVVSLEDLHESLVLAPVVVEALELVTARSEGARGRVAEG